MQVLPRVVDEIVWMVKDELGRSSGEIRRAADDYVDTVVSNAVLSVRGRLDAEARQRDASRTVVVASNDNRSNRSSRSSRKRCIARHY